jgi:hypothetical protein
MTPIPGVVAHFRSQSSMVADVRVNWVYTEPNPGEAHDNKKEAAAREAADEAAEMTLKFEENRFLINFSELK